MGVASTKSSNWKRHCVDRHLQLVTFLYVGRYMYNVFNKSKYSYYVCMCVTWLSVLLQYPVCRHLWLYSPLYTMHSTGTCHHAQRTLRTLRQTRGRKPLPQDQDSGRLLLLREWSPRADYRSCSLLCGNGVGYDRDNWVGTQTWPFPLTGLKTVKHYRYLSNQS